MSKATETRNKKHDFFISYYSGTGFVFAKYLREHAKDFGRDAFLDKVDIDKNINEETDEWRSQIDQAIEESNNVILIMTLGFKERREIKRELEKAWENGISVFLFKKDDLDDRELILEIDTKTIDFSKNEYTPFSDACDLLTKVEDTLRGKRVSQKKSSFVQEAEKIIATEGLEIKQANIPILEMVVGASYDNEEWLPANSQNGNLLRLSPYHCNCGQMRPKRGFFEYEPYNKEKPLDFFLKVTTNGFFHLVEPLRHDELFYLDVFFHQILEMLFYCITVMKNKQLNTKQSAVIYLRNVRNLDVRLGSFQRARFSFSNSAPEPFFAEFNPSSDWKEIGVVVQKVYGELCQEIGYTDTTEEIIKQRLREIVRSNFYRSPQEHIELGHYHILLPAIQADDLGFVVEKKKEQK